MKTSRQKLFAYLQQRTVVSVPELSAALRMTPANARHHLRILQEQGLVEIVGERQPAGSQRGRPILLYGLSRHSRGHNLDGLLSALLKVASDQPGGLGQEDFLRQAARRLAEQTKKSESPERAAAPEDGGKRTAPLSARLVAIIQQLNTWRYQARWEARREAPRVILGNCPYAAILAEHPEICRFDHYLLQALMDLPVEQVARLVPDYRGLPQCVFRVTST